MSTFEVSNELGVTVIICCYNSAKRLPETIRHLASQNVTPETKWELVVVDNASKDETATLAHALCMQYLSNIPFKVVYESEAGLSSARKRGIAEARYEFLLFCDDDNWLNNDYIQIGYNTMMANPRVGVLGGQSIGEYEVTPPNWFIENGASFAIGKQNDQSGDITYKKGAVWGAGFIVRSSIYQLLKNNNFVFILSDRKGNELSTGGDRELCLAVRRLGYIIYYEERLVTKHYMPASRFNFKSFLKLSYQNGKVTFVYDAYNNKVRRYGLYLLTNLPPALFKLVVSSVILLVSKVFANTSSQRYRSARRMNYFAGRLKTLLDIEYSKVVIKTIEKNISK